MIAAPSTERAAVVDALADLLLDVLDAEDRAMGDEADEHIADVAVAARG